MRHLAASRGLLRRTAAFRSSLSTVPFSDRTGTAEDASAALAMISSCRLPAEVTTRTCLRAVSLALARVRRWSTRSDLYSRDCIFSFRKYAIGECVIHQLSWYVFAFRTHRSCYSSRAKPLTRRLFARIETLEESPKVSERSVEEVSVERLRLRGLIFRHELRSGTSSITISRRYVSRKR